MTSVFSKRSNVLVGCRDAYDQLKSLLAGVYIYTSSVVQECVVSQHYVFFFFGTAAKIPLRLPVRLSLLSFRYRTQISGECYAYSYLDMRAKFPVGVLIAAGPAIITVSLVFARHFSNR